MPKRLFDLPPAQGMPIEIGTLLTALDDSTREWREELGTVPVEGLVWQPFPGGHSIGAVLLHIADAENFWIQEMCLGEKTPPEFLAEVLSEETKQDDVTWPTPPAQPLDWYLDKLERVRAKTREALTRLPDPLGTVTKEEWDMEVTRRWALAHVVEHDSYHGGQAVLLKLLWERMK